jgi:hypothetical protein
MAVSDISFPSLSFLEIKQGLVNGSRGVVEAFKLVPIVKDHISGEERLVGPGDIDKFPGCRFEDLKYNQKTEFDGKIWRICRFEKYPLVRFVNNLVKIITPFAFERTHFRQGQCFRSQIPLRLAWALTIHKSQGESYGAPVCLSHPLQDSNATFVSPSSLSCVFRCHVGLRRCGFAGMFH